MKHSNCVCVGHTYTVSVRTDRRKNNDSRGERRCAIVVVIAHESHTNIGVSLCMSAYVSAFVFIRVDFIRGDSNFATTFYFWSHGQFQWDAPLKPDSEFLMKIVF